MTDQYDVVVVGAGNAAFCAALAAQEQGARVLVLSVFANPADLMRVLTLSLAGTPHLLGAAGESWNRVLGGAGWAACLAWTGLAAWTGVPLLIARAAVARKDL